jgi:hypothetical protein
MTVENTRLQPITPAATSTPVPDVAESAGGAITPATDLSDDVFEMYADQVAATAATDVHTLLKEVDVDWNAIWAILNRLDPSQIPAMKEAWASHYNGADMAEDLKAAERGSDALGLGKDTLAQKRLDAYFAGDRAKADAYAIREQIWGNQDSPAVILDILRNPSPEHRLAVAHEYLTLFAAETGNPQGLGAVEFLANDLDQSQSLGDLNAQAALGYLNAAKVTGTEQATAFEVEALRAEVTSEQGDWIGKEPGRIIAALAGATPEARKQLREDEAFKQGLKEHLSSPDANYAIAVLWENPAGIVASQMEAAIAAKDSSALVSLAFEVGAEQAPAVAQAYESATGRSLEEDLKVFQDGSGKYGQDSATVQVLENLLGFADSPRTGPQMDALILDFAMNRGTLKPVMARMALAGKTKEEIGQIDTAYKAITGRGLRDDLSSKLSGRAKTDILQLFDEGAPKDTKDLLARLKEQVEMELGGTGGLIDGARQLLQGESFSARIQQDIDRADAALASGDEASARTAVLDLAKDLAGLQGEKEALSHWAATAAAMGAGAAVSALSAGTLTPVAVIMVAGIAGGGAQVAGHALFEGGAYDVNGMPMDYAWGVMNGAGSVFGLGKGGPTGLLGGKLPSLTGKMSQTDIAAIDKILKNFSAPAKADTVVEKVLPGASRWYQPISIDDVPDQVLNSRYVEDVEYDKLPVQFLSNQRDGSVVMVAKAGDGGPGQQVAVFDKHGALRSYQLVENGRVTPLQPGLPVAKGGYQPSPEVPVWSSAFSGDIRNPFPNLEVSAADVPYEITYSQGTRFFKDGNSYAAVSGDRVKVFDLQGTELDTGVMKGGRIEWRKPLNEPMAELSHGRAGPYSPVSASNLDPAFSGPSGTSAGSDHIRFETLAGSKVSLWQEKVTNRVVMVADRTDGTARVTEFDTKGNLLRSFEASKLHKGRRSFYDDLGQLAPYQRGVEEPAPELGAINDGIYDGPRGVETREMHNDISLAALKNVDSLAMRELLARTDMELSGYWVGDARMVVGTRADESQEIFAFSKDGTFIDSGPVKDGAVSWSRADGNPLYREFLGLNDSSLTPISEGSLPRGFDTLGQGHPRAGDMIAAERQAGGELSFYEKTDGGIFISSKRPDGSTRMGLFFEHEGHFNNFSSVDPAGEAAAINGWMGKGTSGTLTDISGSFGGLRGGFHGQYEEIEVVRGAHRAFYRTGDGNILMVSTRPSGERRLLLVDSQHKPLKYARQTADGKIENRKLFPDTIRHGYGETYPEIKAANELFKPGGSDAQSFFPGAQRVDLDSLPESPDLLQALDRPGLQALRNPDDGSVILVQGDSRVMVFDRHGRALDAGDIDGAFIQWERANLRVPVYRDVVPNPGHFQVSSKYMVEDAFGQVRPGPRPDDFLAAHPDKDGHPQFFTSDTEMIIVSRTSDDEAHVGLFKEDGTPVKFSKIDLKTGATVEAPPPPPGIRDPKAAAPELAGAETIIAGQFANNGVDLLNSKSLYEGLMESGTLRFESSFKKVGDSRLGVGFTNPADGSFIEVKDLRVTVYDKHGSKIDGGTLQARADDSVGVRWDAHQPGQSSSQELANGEIYRFQLGDDFLMDVGDFPTASKFIGQMESEGRFLRYFRVDDKVGIYAFKLDPNGVPMADEVKLGLFDEEGLGLSFKDLSKGTVKTIDPPSPSLKVATDRFAKSYLSREKFDLKIENIYGKSMDDLKPELEQMGFVEYDPGNAAEGTVSFKREGGFLVEEIHFNHSKAGELTGVNFDSGPPTGGGVSSWTIKYPAGTVTWTEAQRIRGVAMQ